MTVANAGTYRGALRRKEIVLSFRKRLTSASAPGHASEQQHLLIVTLARNCAASIRSETVCVNGSNSTDRVL